MLLEDYLSYSYLLRNSLVNLPKSIASKNIGIVNEEVKHLHQISIDDISDYLLFKKVDELELNNNDKEFVTKYLKIFSKDIYERLKRIVKFFDNYYRVYIKYKHIF